ncbi:MAG: carboxypeptidase regulatory-like domain-containing protein [Candidatus Thermoplasmatota archaeon]
MSSSWFGKLTGKKEKQSSGARWLEENWPSLASLAGIFIVALFIRSYFAFDLATEFGTPYLLGGGADSHYNARIINYIVENKEHLFSDPLRTYPLLQGENVRPPLYQWSVVLIGHVLAPFVGSLDKGVQLSFILSSGLWGALATIPVYLIGKNTFGRKAGIAGAFLLAISAGHLERGVITNTNHDAFSLFFVLTAFYFFMRTLEEIPDDEKWVSDWMDLDRIKHGLLQFFGSNKRALLYAAMTGMSLGSVALAWKGYAYAVVIILVYFLIQLVIDKFRDRDSLGITVSIFVTMMIAFAISFPWYATHRPQLLTEWFQWPLENWYQAPFFIFLGTFGLGVYFTVTRELPWILTFAILAVAGVLFFALGPDMIQSVASQYFIQNKLYSTIAEAQAPDFSRLVMAGGIATFFLSWVGLAFAVWHVIGNWTRSFVFILVWAAFSIYMTTQAARFIFTAAPGYALTAGWVLALIFDKTDFKNIGRIFRSHRGSTLRGVKEGVKIKHILVSLGVVFLLLMPNGLYAFDAGIPFEEKGEYDDQIHDTLPEKLRSPEYDEGGRNHYLGAFGYSLDKPTDYWETSWKWLRQQDTDRPPEERPAFLSWWDYGFECISQGDHPTVADNFQHGYHLAGNVLMSQNESEALGLLIGRQLLLPYRDEGGFKGDVRDILIEHIGEEKTEKLEDIYDNPSSYRNEVLSNPDRYHPRADDIDDTNIRWAMVMGTLSYESLETISSLYRDICLNSGYERLKNRIGYLAVDSRLFPTSARDTGIFHAPAYLSGHRVEGERGMKTPIDFYTMELIDAEGRRYESRDDVPPEAEIVDQEINFKPMYYNSILYNVFAGYAGQHIGEDEAIPGLQNRRLQPMPGWNLTHFKMEHRTAYFNPYPRDEVQNHTDAWKAISFEEAKEYQEDENVTVDMSARSYMRQGVVFLRYYDGAIMEGQVTTKEGNPVPNAKITVLDENGVAHHTSRTDEEGRYRATLPAGNVSVTVTTGGEEGSKSQQRMLKQEEISLAQTKVEISQEQAMRKKIDNTGDGRWDYLLEEDFEVDSGKVSGKVFLDSDDTGEFDEQNETLVQGEGEVMIENEQSGLNYTISIENGTYEKTEMVPGKYSARASILGSDSADITLEPEGDVSQNLPISVGELRGNVTYEEGLHPAENEDSIELSLKGSGQSTEINVGESKEYVFEDLTAGNYTLYIESDGYTLKQGPRQVNLQKGGMNNKDIHIIEARRVEGVITRGGEPVPDQKLSILGRNYNRVITTDKNGEFDIKMPEEVYQIYGINRRDESTYVHMGILRVDSDVIGEDRYVGELKRGHKLRGKLEYEGEGAQNAEVFITKSTGEYHYVTTNEEGRFSAYLPMGDYTVYGWLEVRREPGEEVIQPQQAMYFLDKVSLNRNREIKLEGEEGQSVTGSVNRDLLTRDEIEHEYGLYTDIKVSFGEVTFMRPTDIEGNYKFVLPDEKIDLRFSEEGYHEEILRMNPEDIPEQISLEAKNVSVEGSLDFDDEKVEELTIEFESISDGAVGKNITVEENSYQVELQPGEYKITIEETMMNGSAKYQLTQDLSISPGADTVIKDLEAIYRVKVIGSIIDEEGELSSADIHFSGVEERKIEGANRSYDTYLQPGNYSIRAVNSEGEDELSMQKRLYVNQSMTSNITLKESIPVRAYLAHKGDRKSEIPVIFENNRTGYVIETTSKAHGEFNMSLSRGEYRVQVDLAAEEEIDGLERDVIYSLDEVLHTDKLGTPGALAMDREVLNSTFSGTVNLNNQALEGVEVQILSEGDEIDVLMTDETGYFEKDELLHGRYTIHITYSRSRDFYARFSSFIMSAENKHMEISLEEAAILEGRVILDGEGVEDEDLEIRRGEALKKISTDEMGDYRVVLPKGNYEITSETDKDTDDYGLTSFSYTEEIDLKYDMYHRINLRKVMEYIIEVDDLETKQGSQDETLTYRAQIKNAGNTRDEYELSAEETEWDVEFETKKFSLNAGETKTVEVTVTIPEDAVVDHESVMFTVDSMNSEESVEKEIPVEVRSIYGIELSTEFVNRKLGYGEMTCTIEINNTGNIEDRYDLRVTNRDRLRDQGWSVSVISRTENITAQESKSVEIKLNPIGSQPKEDVEIELRAVSTTDNEVKETSTLKTSVPQITADIDTIELKGEKVQLEEDSFTLSNFQWGLIILAAALVSVYVMKKKRWI